MPQPPRWNIEPVISGSMRHRPGCAPGRRARGFGVCGDPGASGTAVAAVMAAAERSRDRLALADHLMPGPGDYARGKVAAFAHCTAPDWYGLQVIEVSGEGIGRW